MITRGSKDKVLDYIDSLISTHRIGEGNTTPTVDDTDLVIPIVGLDSSIPRIRANDILNATIIRGNSSSGGSFKEAGIKDVDNELFIRVVHVPIITVPNDNTRVIYNYKFFVE